MSCSVCPACVHESEVVGGPPQHVGDRYLRWVGFQEPKLSVEAKAVAHDRFAAEFEALSPHEEPYAGWADTMADLCRRIARLHRGQPAGERVSSRQRHRPGGEGPDAALRDVS